MKVLIKLSELITCISEKIERIKGKLPEILALVLYSSAHLFMGLVHEPWFDEALAWLIARDSSVKTVLLEATHYEGHPGLWHLVLMPFAQSGAPYELSLSLVSLLFSGTAVALILFKAPFKRIIRLLAPFTYFLFYQFGVIGRPYCMMMLAFVLIAILYKSKDDKPGRYIAALAFLCATSAYGIVIAGSLCIVWLIEMALSVKNRENGTDSNVNKHGFSGFMSELCDKRKILHLALLLAYAFSIIWRILPASDAYASLRATKAEPVNGLFTRMIYTVFTSLSDLFVTNVYCSLGTIRDTNMNAVEMWMGAFVGAGILAVIIYYGRKYQKLLTFMVPYLMFTIFGSVVYLYSQHIGIELLFIGFYVWICKDNNSVNQQSSGRILPQIDLENKQNAVENKTVKTDKFVPEKTSALDEIKTFLPSMGIIMAAIFAIIPLYWSIASCICDINFEYSYGKHEYEFLRDNDLLEVGMFCEWSQVFTEPVEGYDSYDVTFSMQEVCMAPYMTDNQLYNRRDELGLSYALLHKIRNSDENAEMINKMSEMDPPEVIMGMPELGKVYDMSSLNLNDYEKVMEERTGIIWKGIPGSSSSCLYVRKEKLLNKK